MVQSSGCLEWNSFAMRSNQKIDDCLGGRKCIRSHPPVRIFARAPVRASDLKRAGRSPSRGISKYVVNLTGIWERCSSISAGLAAFSSTTSITAKPAAALLRVATIEARHLKCRCRDVPCRDHAQLPRLPPCLAGGIRWRCSRNSLNRENGRMSLPSASRSGPVRYDA